MSVTPTILYRFGWLIPALAAAACTPDAASPPQASLESTVQPRSQVMALADSRTSPMSRWPTSRWPTSRTSSRPRMVALPAEAGDVGAVSSRDYADGFRQDIALHGARVPLVRNGMTIVARSQRVDTLEERAPLAKPSEGAVRSEIGAAMPHVAMQIVESERSNAYGPYGLALGRTGADTRCAYMWQWIDADRLPRDAGLAGPVSVRIRLCQAGTTFDTMAGWMDHLVIGPQDAAVVADAGGFVAPPAVDSEPAPQRKKAAARRHRRPAAVARRDDARLAAIEPPEPAPEGARYLTSAAVTPAAVHAQPVAAAPSAPAGPKFGGDKFGGDLPPQAFAGPTSSTSSTSRP